MADTAGLLFRISSNSEQAKADLKQFSQTVDREVSNAAGAGGFAKMQTAVSSVVDSLGKIGSQLSQVGSQLSVAFTLPLAAIGALGVKAALELDTVRTKITALVGDAGEANKKINDLRSLANSSVGVTQAAALETFAQLKGIGGIADETINKVIGSLGKLNAAFKIDDLAGFNQNLNQIFTQGFERADIKEAIGRVPFFEQLLQSAFGTTDGAKLKKLKDSGKLTLDGFMSGLSDAIEKDPRIGNITENLTVKMAKSFERLNVALAPLGEIILNAIIPIIEAAAPYLEQLSQLFSDLSPTIKIVVVAFGGIAAALAPVLLAVGGLISAVTTIAGAVAALGGLSTVLPIVAAVGAALAVLAGAAYLIYQAWQTNFGGLKTYTLEIFDAIKSGVSVALSAISDVTNSAVGQIVAFWRSNYPLIQQTVETVSNAIKSTVGAALSAISDFWKTYGDQIVATVKTTWNFVSSYIKSTAEAIGGVIKFVLQVINGDWSAAWETFGRVVGRWTAFSTDTVASAVKSIISGLVSVGTAIYNNFTDIMVKAGLVVAAGIAKIAQAFIDLPTTLVNLAVKFYNAGASIAAAIYKGFKEGIVLQAEAVGNITPPPTPQGGGGQTTPPNAEPPNAGLSDEGLEKRRKAQLDAEEKFNSATKESLEQAFKEFQEATKESYQTRAITAERYLSDIEESERRFRVRMIELAKDDTKLKSQNETTDTGKAALALQERTTIEKIQSDSDKRFDAAKKLVTETDKKEADKRVKITEDELKNKLELEKANLEKRRAENESWSAANKRLESNRIAENTKITQDGISDEIRLNQDLLNNTELTEEKRSEIRQRVSVLEVSLNTEKINGAAAVAKAIETESKAADDAARKAAENLEKIRLQVLRTENDLKEFQNEQQRKILANNAENATGKGRIVALIAVRDFELTENDRRRDAANAEAIAEHDLALAKLTDKEKEKGAEKAINDLLIARQAIIKGEHADKEAGTVQSAQPAINQAGIDASGGGFLGGILGGIGIDAKQLAKPLDILNEIGKTLSATFGQVSQAVGEAVHSFVLFGTAGGSFKKFAAEMIASIAQMAAVQAVFELAQGLAMLALAAFGFHPTAGASATEHFAAAAVFGGIAGIAAVAGRAVAGDSFKNQASASGSFGKTSSTDSDNGTGRTSGTAGNYYSSAGDSVKTVNEDRMTRIENALANMKTEVTIKGEIKMQDGFIYEHIADGIKNRNSVLENALNQRIIDVAG